MMIGDNWIGYNWTFQVATYTFLEQLSGQNAGSEKEKALACQVEPLTIRKFSKNYF